MTECGPAPSCHSGCSFWSLIMESRSRSKFGLSVVISFLNKHHFYQGLSKEQTGDLWEFLLARSFGMRYLKRKITIRNFCIACFFQSVYLNLSRIFFCKQLVLVDLRVLWVAWFCMQEEYVTRASARYSSEQTVDAGAWYRDKKNTIKMFNHRPDINPMQSSQLINFLFIKWLYKCYISKRAIHFYIVFMSDVCG